jgi:hypothetical protein
MRNLLRDLAIIAVAQLGSEKARRMALDLAADIESEAMIEEIERELRRLGLPGLPRVVTTVPETVEAMIAGKNIIEWKPTRRRGSLPLLLGGRHTPFIGLARRVVGTWPQDWSGPVLELTHDQAVDLEMVYGDRLQAPISGAPLRAPHHSTSTVGMLGNHYGPGEVQLAGAGVLFLDEVENFRNLDPLFDALKRGEVPRYGRDDEVTWHSFMKPHTVLATWTGPDEPSPLWHHRIADNFDVIVDLRKYKWTPQGWVLNG